MPFDQIKLAAQAYQLRKLSILATSKAGSGHVTSCLSAADLVAATFFHAMQFDPCDMNKPTNDRFILSKGHAAPLLYAVFVQLGLISQQELMTLRQFDSNLEGHPTPRCPWVEVATGSLGQGLSYAVGFALSARFSKQTFYTYVLLGDSEVAEGSVWEAAELAAFYQLNSIIAILDVNRLGQSTETMEGYDLEQYEAKFQAFGWHTITVNGHDLAEIVLVLDAARKQQKPTIIIAKTEKGYGVARVENKEGFHGKAFPEAQVPAILEELAQRFPQAHEYALEHKIKELPCKPTLPGLLPALVVRLIPEIQEQEIATRKAYGQALVELGRQSDKVIVLDAEVKNSTYAELFEKKFPERFVQCFVAEQNMVGMAIGLARRGFVPYVSTFASFFSRAYDQLRMAAIGQAPLRLAGSHAGVSIGQDGPSQMGLEDIALMRALPNSIVLYPCDAVSTYKLVALMAGYNRGISYVRLTRGQTPILYDAQAEFALGSCTVLKESKEDQVCIIAAGITVFQALEAYKALKVQGIFCRLIDCYSIKPLPETQLRAAVKACNGRVITVEDHYLAGGLGESVAYALCNDRVRLTTLAVMHLPGSGTPKELLHDQKIDAAAIIESVMKLLL